MKWPPGNNSTFHLDKEISVTDYISLQKLSYFYSQKTIYRAVLFWNMEIYEKCIHYKFNVYRYIQYLFAYKV